MLRPPQERLLRQSASDGGLVSETDFVCATLVELGLVEAETLGTVREQIQTSNRAETHMSTVHVVGTREYMPPEVRSMLQQIDTQIAD